jgi:hypothetical protein
VLPGIQLNRTPAGIIDVPCSCTPKETVEAAADANAIASFGRRVSWATSPRIRTSRPYTCRCSARESQFSPQRHPFPRLRRCNRGARCQWSCAKYPRPFRRGKPRPSGPGIMPTYHGRHVVATRPGLPSSPDQHQTRSTQSVRPSSSCNDHLSMQLTANLDYQVTWRGPWFGFPCERCLLSQLPPLPSAPSAFPRHHTFVNSAAPTDAHQQSIDEPPHPCLAAAAHLIN